MTLHQPSHHESAHGHVSGAARYVDDLPRPPGLLVGLPVGSPIACGRLLAVGRAAALALPGVHAVLLASDIPGHNRIGPIVHDEPLLADGPLHAVGQLVALVVGESLAVCRATTPEITARSLRDRPHGGTRTRSTTAATKPTGGTSHSARTAKATAAACVPTNLFTRPARTACPRSRGRTGRR